MSSHAQPQAGGPWGPPVSTGAPPLGLASTFTSAQPSAGGPSVGLTYNSFQHAQPLAGGPWGGSASACPPSFGLAAPSYVSAQPSAGGPSYGLTLASAQPSAGGPFGLTHPAVPSYVSAQPLAGGPSGLTLPAAPSFAYASAQPSAGGPFYGQTLASAQLSAGGSSSLTLPAHSQPRAGRPWVGPAVSCAPSLSLASAQLSAGVPSYGPSLSSAQPTAGGLSSLTFPGLVQPPAARPGLVWSLSQARSSALQPGLGPASFCAPPYYQASVPATAAPMVSVTSVSQALGLSLPPQLPAVGGSLSPAVASAPRGAPTTASRPTTPFRPWDGQANYEPISPPCPPLEAEREISGKSLPSILRYLQSVDGKLVAHRPHRTHIQSEAESMAQEHQLPESELLAAQSPLLGDLFQAVGLEVSGHKASVDKDSAFRGPPSKPLRSGQFLPPKNLRPFKASPLLGPGPLPSGPLGLAEGDKVILASHEGKSNAALTCTLSDKALSEWEEFLRLALESSSLSDTLTNVLYKDARGRLVSPVSPEQREALLLATSTAIRSTMDCLVRAYFNIILARRDGVLAKAKSRLPAADKEALRSLPLDPPSLFGQEVAKTPSLQPPSEATLAVREMAKALTPKKPTPGTSSSAQQQASNKRRFGSSPKGKTPQKSPRFAPYRKGSQGQKSMKPSSKAPVKGKHPQ